MGAALNRKQSTNKTLGHLRDMLLDAETLVGAYEAGYNEESIAPLRDRLKANLGRINDANRRAREELQSGGADPGLSHPFEVLALAAGIGTLVVALADRHRGS
jgi:hypothetical protein